MGTMARPKYPHSTLEQVRQKKVDASALAHAEARTQREGAEAARDGKVREKDALVAHAKTISDREQSAFEQGGLTVDQLARRFDFEEGVRIETDALETQIASADEVVREASNVELVARLDLQSRIADRRVIEKDKERFLSDAQKREEKKEEEQIEEAWRPKRS